MIWRSQLLYSLSADTMQRDTYQKISYTKRDTYEKISYTEKMSYV